MTITQQTLLECLEYIDGKLYWKKPTSVSTKVGQEAGCNNNGYRLLKLNKQFIQTHRAIFLMHYGFLPEIVDHIDGNKLNCRRNNLMVGVTDAKSTSKRTKILPAELKDKILPFENG